MDIPTPESDADTERALTPEVLADDAKWRNVFFKQVAADQKDLGESSGKAEDAGKEPGDEKKDDKKDDKKEDKKDDKKDDKKEDKDKSSSSNLLTKRGSY